MATLEQLENDDWGETDAPTWLVQECHRLRRKPIEEFNNEDLRIMIGQNIGLKYLVPKALEVLRKDPLAAGDFYEGDLLRAVIRCKLVSEQQKGSGFIEELRALCTSALAELPNQTRQNIFGNYSPEDLGMNPEAVKVAVDQAVEKEYRQSPWKEYREFTGH
ncbi:hypothetical protein K1W69_11395 [Hoeflea sp. WL0058]|uniref:Uncharacterized protein n=1 Tax=Flavimaribacter sediminis TaxID=2865987 RepID=A0AAE3D1P8_9HYPH|nr:contact-dependent growth inhibition system immunity protein [Flavimaribacter sediminis]MBW8637793.1 hypothetical protein [Flavimaribacter sediminis]